MEKVTSSKDRTLSNEDGTLQSAEKSVVTVSKNSISSKDENTRFNTDRTRQTNQTSTDGLTAEESTVTYASTDKTKEIDSDGSTNTNERSTSIAAGLRDKKRNAVAELSSDGKNEKTFAATYTSESQDIEHNASTGKKLGSESKKSVEVGGDGVGGTLSYTNHSNSTSAEFSGGVHWDGRSVRISGGYRESANRADTTDLQRHIRRCLRTTVT